MDDDKNFFMQYLKGKQLGFFNEISGKVPQDDALIDGLWFMYKYEPESILRKTDLTLPEFNEINKIIYNLHNKNSRSTEFQLITKHTTISYIIEYLITPAFLSNLNKKEYEEVDNLIQYICNTTYPLQNSSKPDKTNLILSS